MLINISNDGWFGRSAAPAQHLMMARVRAVENRRWLLRDTNNGYTVSVDPYGRIVAQLATDIRGELDAPYDFRSDLTPYARFGDWFAWLCDDRLRLCCLHAPVSPSASRRRTLRSRVLSKFGCSKSRKDPWLNTSKTSSTATTS